MVWNHEKVKEKVIEIVRFNLGCESGECHENTDFKRDFSADDLDVVDIIMQVEEEFDIAFDVDECLHCRTVHDLITSILKNLKKKG